MNREDWLKAAGDLIAVEFELPLSRPWRVSTGSPARQGKSLGHCYASAAVSDGANEVWVNASIVDPLQILGVLLHELLHATDDCASGHSGAFQRQALRAGFLPPLKTYAPSAELTARLQGLLDCLPACPIVRVAPSPPKKGRMIKLLCDNPVCGWLCYTAQARIDALPNDPLCPCCEAGHLHQQSAA